MSYYRFPKYVSVAEKKAKAAKKLKQLKKKRPDIQPIIIEGKSLTSTWWGKAWNNNLTKYADYSNRVGRGRSYLRHGAVLDLQIESGAVEALVQGSSNSPYKVRISIEKIKDTHWKNIKKECQGKIDSLQELLQGKFPKALSETFTSKEHGLFPSPREIDFSCSCPDWASMCKHVAAVLFGIGSRLDDDPMLFFKLRGIDGNELVAQAVKDNTSNLLEKAKKKSKRVLDNIDISDVFGIDMEDDSEKEPTEKKTPKKRAVGRPKKRKANETSKKKVSEIPKKKIKKKKIAKNKKTSEPILSKEDEMDVVLKTIRRSRKGIDMATLQKRTGIENKQRMYNCVYQLLNKGEIQRIDRGIYK
jgi:uncharacterized Zn finger protein